MSLRNQNEVPERPGWFYGLAVRMADGTLSVPVHGPNGERVTIEGERYWGDVHRRALELTA